MPTDESDEALRLARDLLDDIELSRLTIEPLIYKASRLARLVGDGDVQEWLGMERLRLSGGDLGKRYMTLTGRWTDKEKGEGWWDGAPSIETQVDAWKAQLAVLRLPDLSGEYLNVPLGNIQRGQTVLSEAIARHGKILARVRGLIHQFVSTHYYELLLSEQQAELFDATRIEVDQRLAPLSGDALAKVESIYRRLGEGDPEAVSQALSTCRRLIEAVADAVYPARDGTVLVGGNEVGVGPSQQRNRLNAYVNERVSSSGRRERLRHTLSDLFSRVSSGVHAEVDISEARYLFLATYMYLGEVLTLAEPTRAETEPE